MPLLLVRTRDGSYEADSISQVIDMIEADEAAALDALRQMIRDERNALVDRFKSEPNFMARTIANLVMAAKYGDLLQEVGKLDPTITPPRPSPEPEPEPEPTA